MSAGITVRPFTDEHKSQVRELFISVTRLLCSPNLRDAFEAYIMWSLAEEIDRIPAYYSEKGGGFWVALEGDCLVGMFGLEQVTNDAMELRRMYVDAGARRRGIACQMLQFAEDECRRRKVFKLELSTSELQSAALVLYRNAGYRLVREEFAETASNSCDTTLKNICEERGSASWNGSFLAGAPPYGA